MSHGAQGAGDGCLEKFDVVHLMLLSIGGGNEEIRELTMVLLVPLRALILLLLGLLGPKLGELMVELPHLCHGVVVLVGAAEGGVAESDGDGSEHGRVESAR